MEKQDLNQQINDGLSDETMDKIFNVVESSTEQLVGNKLHPDTMPEVKQMMNKYKKLIDKILSSAARGDKWVKHVGFHLAVALIIGIATYPYLIYKLISYIINLI